MISVHMEFVSRHFVEFWMIPRHFTAFWIISLHMHVGNAPICGFLEGLTTVTTVLEIPSEPLSMKDYC